MDLEKTQKTPQGVIDVSTEAPSSKAGVRLGNLFYELFPDATSRNGRDLIYFISIIKDFSNELDVEEELKRYYAWTLDRPQHHESSPRSRFRDWLLRSRTFRLRTPH
jgi:hypothetical protein